MLTASLPAPSIAVDANQIRRRAPLVEQYVRQIEDQTFTNQETGRPFTFAEFSTAVKRFGYSGLTHLNERHVEASLAQLYGSSCSQQIVLVKKYYFSTTSSEQQKADYNLRVSEVAVDHLLKVSALLCSHASQSNQVDELWFLANRFLEDSIPKESVVDLITSLTAIAVESARSVLVSSIPQQAYEKSQLSKSLEFLTNAEALAPAFLDSFAKSLPERLNFDYFKGIVSGNCMNASQLRMKITNTGQSTAGRSVVISQVSTLMLEFLPLKEQILTCQLVCKKWYSRFVPRVIRKLNLNFSACHGRTFRLRFESDSAATGQPIYLGLITNQASDVREKCGRTNYVSAGTTAEYEQFRWTIDAQGSLKAVDGSGASLAAHRTYVSDCIGREATLMISTVYSGHENKWRLERYGDYMHQRYLVALCNSKCVKDSVNMISWLASARYPLPQALQQSMSGKDMQRNEDSRYVYVCDRKLVPFTEMPVWQLELDEQ